MPRESKPEQPEQPEADSKKKEEAEKVDISQYHGPGAEGDVMGYLLGAEQLPMVGAAGVLVLPKRLEQMEKLREKKKKPQARFK